MNSIQEKVKNYKQEMAKKYEQEAYKAYESVSGKKLIKNEDGSYPPQGRNDAVDAFRHAYVSAAIAQDYTAFLAKIAGDEVENKGDAKGQLPKERNMDDWNNAVGREIGSSTDTREEIKMAVFIVHLCEPLPRKPARIWGNRLRSNVFKKYQMDCGGS